MSLELELQKYPKDIKLKDGSKCKLRPLHKDDEKNFHQFFVAVPEPERMFIKHRVIEPQVIRDWCRNIDLGRNLPLLALIDGKIVADATLHQQLGGWKRHIGLITVLTHPNYRGRDVAKMLVEEQVEIARNMGLRRLEAELNGERKVAIRALEQIGFQHLMKVEDYVLDMKAVMHDYVVMGMDLRTDEEYAGVGG